MGKNILQTSYSGNNGASDLFVLSSNASEQKKAVMEEEAAFMQVKQKYKNQILAEVYFTDRLSHLYLSNRLGVSASGLNATVKKVNDIDPKPLREIPAGKFKYYSLTEDGKKYVETEILSRLWDSEQNKEDVCNIWKLLNDYKESNQGKWNECFTKLLSEEAGISEERKDSDELVYEFLREYSDFYYRETEKAENLLSLLIADKELRQRIVSYVKIEYENHKGTVFDILNRWTEQNCEEVYQMVDQMFQDVKAGTKMADTIEVSLQGAEEYLEEIQNKILADILRASFRHLRKEELADEWIREDMGKQLAFYVAEKYKVLSDSISCGGKDC